MIKMNTECGKLKILRRWCNSIYRQLIIPSRICTNICTIIYMHSKFIWEKKMKKRFFMNKRARIKTRCFFLRTRPKNCNFIALRKHIYLFICLYIYIYISSILSSSIFFQTKMQLVNFIGSNRRSGSGFLGGWILVRLSKNI